MALSFKVTSLLRPQCRPARPYSSHLAFSKQHQNHRDNSLRPKQPSPSEPSPLMSPSMDDVDPVSPPSDTSPVTKIKPQTPYTSGIRLVPFPDIPIP
jgi:hypothetical protein